MLSSYNQCLKTSARFVAASQLLYQALVPDICFSGYEFDCAHQCRTTFFKAQGVTTINIPHALMVEPICTITFEPHIRTQAEMIVSFGLGPKKRLVQSGYSDQCIPLIGDLNCGRVDETVPKTKSMQNAMLSSKLNHFMRYIDKRPVVLFLTATVGNGIYTPVSHPQKQFETWQYIAQMAIKNPDMAFVIKTHPRYDYYAFYRQLCQAHDSNLFLLGDSLSGHRQRGSDLFLSDILPVTNVAVLVHALSSAVIEVLFKKIPLIYLRHAMYHAEQLNSNPLNHTGCVVIEQLDDLESTVQQLIMNDTLRQKVIQQGQNLLQQEYTYIGETALQRALDFLRQQQKPKRPDPATLDNQAIYISMIANAIRIAQEKHDQQVLKETFELLSPFLSNSPQAVEQMASYAQIVSNLSYLCF